MYHGDGVPVYIRRQSIARNMASCPHRRPPREPARLSWQAVFRIMNPNNMAAPHGGVSANEMALTTGETP